MSVTKAPFYTHLWSKLAKLNFYSLSANCFDYCCHGFHSAKKVIEKVALEQMLLNVDFIGHMMVKSGFLRRRVAVISYITPTAYGSEWIYERRRNSVKKYNL